MSEMAAGREAGWTQEARFARDEEGARYVIPEHLQSLTRELDCAHKALAGMEERLASVLGPDRPEAIGDPDGPNKAAWSPLADDLHKARRYAASLTARIEQLTRRLEV